MIRRLLAAALLAGSLAVGSVSAQGKGGVVAAVTALPDNCVLGDMVIVTTGSPALWVCTGSSSFTQVGWAGAAGVPSGAIVYVNTGTCPTGYTEVAGLSGKMVRGTVAANGDVGGTGGSDSVTPTFTGSALATHTHTTTATGSNATVAFTPVGTIAWPAGVPTNAAITAGTPAGTNAASATSGNCATTNIAAGTGSATACKATAPNLLVTAQTFTGSALATHTHVISWPAGVPTLTGTSGTVPAETFTGDSVTSSAVSGGTPAGTISAVDTRAAYVKLIGCSKN